MNNKQILAMYEREDTYWWHIGKRYLLRAFVNKYSKKNDTLKMVDIGCGTGGTALALSDLGDIYCVDSSQEALKMCKKRGLKLIKNGAAENTGLASKKFDVIISSDIAEHVRDDMLHFREISRLLSDKGYAFITLPAHKFLWSTHDESLEHFRRYTLHEVKGKLKLAGLEIEYLSYTNFFVFPIVLFYRLKDVFFSRTVIPKASYVDLPPFINSFFSNLLKIETKLMQYGIRLPIGVSLFIVCGRD